MPHAVVRYGAYVAPDCILMPSYVNLGAYVGERTMVDTWATVGSCAQIGADVHLSGGVGVEVCSNRCRPHLWSLKMEHLWGRGALWWKALGLVGSCARSQCGADGQHPHRGCARPEPVETRGEVPPRAVVIPGLGPNRSPRAPTTCLVR